MDIANLDTSLLLAPFMLMMFALAVILWIAMLGGSLQFSLWTCMDKAPSYWRCLAMALIFCGINAFVFFGFHFTLGPQPWYIITAYQMTLQTLLVIAVARCNPLSAFLAAFCHSFFSVIGTLVMIVIMFLTCGSAIRGAMKQKKAGFVQQPAAAATMNPYAQ